MRQTTTHSTATTTTTATTRTRERGASSSPRRVRGTYSVDLGYIREVQVGMGCTAAYVAYVTQHGGLPEKDRQNWPRQYLTLEEVLAVPVDNITPMAPAFAMDLEALTRLARDVCAEAPAAAPTGSAVA